MKQLLEIFSGASVTWVKKPQEPAQRNTLLIPPQANMLELHIGRYGAAFPGAVLSG